MTESRESHQRKEFRDLNRAIKTFGTVSLFNGILQVFSCLQVIIVEDNVCTSAKTRMDKLVTEHSHLPWDKDYYYGQQNKKKKIKINDSFLCPTFLDLLSFFRLYLRLSMKYRKHCLHLNYCSNSLLPFHQSTSRCAFQTLLIRFESSDPNIF